MCSESGRVWKKQEKEMVWMQQTVTPTSKEDKMCLQKQALHDQDSQHQPSVNLKRKVKG